MKILPRSAYSALTLVALVALTTPLDADAQQRRDFVLGIGVGPGYSQPKRDGAANPGSKFGIATDLKVGGMLNRDVAIYVVGLTNIFSSEERWDAGITRDVTVASGLAGVGTSIFLDDSFPLAYIDLAVGASTWTCLESFGGCEDGTGLGFAAGTAFRVSGVTFVDIDAIYGKVNDSISASNVLTFKATFNWLSN